MRMKCVVKADHNTSRTTKWFLSCQIEREIVEWRKNASSASLLTTPTEKGEKMSEEKIMAEKMFEGFTILSPIKRW